MKVCPKRPFGYFNIIHIFLSRRRSDGGRSTVACSRSFDWYRFRHAKEINKTYFKSYSIKHVWPSIISCKYSLVSASPGASYLVLCHQFLPAPSASRQLARPARQQKVLMQQSGTSLLEITTRLACLIRPTPDLGSSLSSCRGVTQQ